MINIIHGSYEKTETWEYINFRILGLCVDELHELRMNFIVFCYFNSSCCVLEKFPHRICLVCDLLGDHRSGGAMFGHLRQGKKLRGFGWKIQIFTKHTLPKTTIAPENRPSRKQTSIPTIHFWVLC